jgi:hypothetical protein
MKTNEGKDNRKYFVLISEGYNKTEGPLGRHVIGNRHLCESKKSLKSIFL